MDLSSDSSLEFTRLELSIDRLVLAYQELLRENRVLREQLQQLTKQQRLLFNKNQQTAVQVKQIIHQLREEIHERSA